MYAEPVLLVTPVLPLVDMTSAPSMKRRAPSSDTIDNAYVPGVTTVSLPCHLAAKSSLLLRPGHTDKEPAGREKELTLVFCRAEGTFVAQAKVSRKSG